MHLDVSVAFPLLTRWQYDACYTERTERTHSWKNWSNLLSKCLTFPKIWGSGIFFSKIQDPQVQEMQVEIYIQSSQTTPVLVNLLKQSSLYNFSVSLLYRINWQWRCWWYYSSLLKRKKNNNKKPIKILVKEVKMCNRKWVLTWSLWSTEINTRFLFLLPFFASYTQFSGSLGGSPESCHLYFN